MLQIAPLRRITVDQPDVDQSLYGGAAKRYLERLAKILPLMSSEALGRTVSLLLQARRNGKRVYVMGNGGSATTASHFVCDLMKTAQVAGSAPLRAFALTDNTPLLTAWANDSDFSRVFAEQVLALVERGDVVIAITASGNSPNVVAGLIAAAGKGASTVGLLGFDGGACKELVDVALHVPCEHYGLAEDTHSAITHAITAAVKQAVEAEASMANLARAVSSAPTSMSGARSMRAMSSDDLLRSERAERPVGVGLGV